MQYLEWYLQMMDNIGIGGGGCYLASKECPGLDIPNFQLTLFIQWAVFYH